ncbi:MAG: ATP-binding protein [Anaerolineae bacterium]|nr:ATP-binding protein [Anaerolineae bacterium]
MNPCPCGYAEDKQKECACSPGLIARYQKRISGPLLDRIDIHIDVPRVDYDKLTNDRLGEPSCRVRARVEAARVVQRDRLAKPLTEDGRRRAQEDLPPSTTHLCLTCNADMGPAEAHEYCKLDENGKALVKAAIVGANGLVQQRRADRPSDRSSPLL